MTDWDSDVELVVNGEQVGTVTDFSADFETDIEPIQTEALDELVVETMKREFQVKARALFTLVGLYKDSGGVMSVERYLRRLQTMEERRWQR